MKDRRALLSILLNISTLQKSEIFKEAKKIGLETSTEMNEKIFGRHLFCLKEFYFEQNNGYLKTDIFKARMEFVSAVGRPVWDCLWEDKASMYVWQGCNLVFKEVFTNKNGEELILVFKFEGEDWTFDFHKLSEYKFTDKDRAVCLAL